jgi:hypothetical protein
VSVAGGCRCGAVRYRIVLEGSPRTYACYCTRCQRASGSAFSIQLPVRTDALSLEGELVTSQLVGNGGAVSTHRHCARCLTRLYNTNEARPGLAIVRAGTIDGSEELTPELHIYTSTKQPWIALPEDVPAYADKAPPEAWARLFTR